MNTNGKYINTTIDIVKFIASCGVVLIHYDFPNMVGKVIYGLARFGVPFFLMVSGYYVYNDDYRIVFKKLPRKIYKIFKMWIITDIVYLVLEFILHGCKIAFFADEIAKWGAGRWYSFLAYQSTWLGFTWYLFALILCYVVTYLIARFNLWKFCIPLSIALLSINLYIGEILPFVRGEESPWNWCSNFALMAFPFYCLGFFTRMHEESFKQFISDRKMLIILALGFVLNMVERILTHASQLFLSNILISFFLLVYCIAFGDRFNKQEGKAGKIIDLVAYLGKYSMYIYLIHPAIKEIAIYIRESAGVSDNILVTNISVVGVLTGTVLITYIIGKIIDGFNNHGIITN